MDYSQFTADDFIKDELFQDWILQPNRQNKLFWENWLANNPDRKPEVEKARNILLSIEFTPRALPEARVKALWDRIQSQTEKVPASRWGPEREPALTRRLYTRWYQVAAVFIGILLAGTVFYTLQEQKEVALTVTTKFGEVKKIILPDQSMVVLNGNSRLTYKKQWSSDEERAVNLAGEAYFSVTHTQNHQKFRVNMDEQMQVEVLGTKFTVTSRSQKKQVVLSEGKVQLAILGSQAKTAVAPVILKPGELLAVYEKPYRFDKRQVANPENYAAFQQNKLVFINAPLSEVARTLEDTYGYHVTFGQPELAAKRFTGSSSANRVDHLLTAISKAFNLIVTQKGENIFIKKA
ncbi:FecR family protein [Larkinella bovis]|uniref:FecR family protein n=1 Tax=Larkinella bovis TaxID=683041 RepID=A0ABW0II27_9BACT